MFTYILALVPFLFLFSSPILNFFSPSSPSVTATIPKIHRLPRPKIKEDLLALEDLHNLTCPEHNYKIHVFSREPLAIYIENFLSVSERQHLLDIAEPLYQPATITHDGGSTADRDVSVRDSEVAVIPRTETVRCVEERARGLQGWREEVWIERLRVQRYKAGGHYGHHFDWSSSRGGWGRVGSFMVWVDASSSSDERGNGNGENGKREGEGKALKGGGTEFPLLKRKEDAKWCKFVECAESRGGDEERKGATFKVVPGNAVYWENFRADGSGRGWEETWHAGLPVEEGVKVGLNIWSWGRIE